MTLRALWQRLTGAEARAIRHQRDAYAEQAGKERQRADAAERALRTADAYRVFQSGRLDAALRRLHEVAKVARQRGQTILKLQHRLTRWQRRYRRAMVALHTWRPEAQAWEQRAREAQERAHEAERELAALRRDLERAERDVTLFQGEAYHAHANAELMADGLAAERAANRVADIGPETWMPGAQKSDE